MKNTLFVLITFFILIGCSSKNKNEEKKDDQLSPNEKSEAILSNSQHKSDLYKMNLKGNVSHVETDDVSAEGNCIANYYFNPEGFVDSVFVIAQTGDYSTKTYNTYNDDGLLTNRVIKSKFGATTYTSIFEFNDLGDEVKSTTTNDSIYPTSITITEKTDSGYYSVQIVKDDTMRKSNRYVTIRNMNKDIIELKTYSYQNKNEKT